MDFGRFFVEEELRRLARKHPPRLILHPRDLKALQAERRRPRSIRWWMGGRLIRAGELLRAWGASPGAALPDGPSQQQP